MKRYGLHGRLTARSDKRNELADILLKAAGVLASLPNCHLYMVSIDKDNDTDIWITEVWDSKEDHDLSLQNPEVRSLIATGMPMIDGAPQKGRELTVLGGLGLTS